MFKQIVLLFCLSSLATPQSPQGARLRIGTNPFGGVLTIGGQVRLRAEGRQDYNFDKSSNESSEFRIPGR